MKKKILTLILTMTVSASMFAGCGNSAETASSGNAATGGTETVEVAGNAETECEHEWVEATCEEAKHCSKCGETEGTALGHTMTEATYREAAVCTVCGETEGKPKQSYFEEHGADVADAPVACTVNALIYNPDHPEEYQMTTDGTWEQIDCYCEPAEEDGYQQIHLELCISIQNYYDAIRNIDYNYSLYSTRLCDWYTGRVFPYRNMFGGGTFVYTTTLDIDGIDYDVSYTKETQWEFDPWVYGDSGNARSNGRCYINYIFKVPDGYDGLVFAAVPTNEYRELDTETISGASEEDAYYAFDEEYIDGTKFFRINKEGTVPERLPEDNTATVR